MAGLLDFGYPGYGFGGQQMAPQQQPYSLLQKIRNSLLERGIGYAPQGPTLEQARYPQMQAGPGVRNDPFNFLMPGSQAIAPPPPLPPPQEIPAQPPANAMPVSMPVTADQAAANPGVAPPPGNPGFGDILNRNALTLMALGGGIAQGGIGRGFSEAAKIAALEQQQQQPKLTETGTDPLTGQKTFAWAFPNQAKLVPASMTGNAAGGTGNLLTNDTIQKIAALREQGAPPSVALQAVPAGYRDYVQSLLEGKAIPTNLGRPGPARGALVALAHAVDPNFDEAQIDLRRAWARQQESTSPNSFGSQVRASGTVVKHLGDAYDQLSVFEQGPLGTSDTLNALNPIKSAIRGQLGEKEYQDARGRWDIARKGIAGELEKLLSGSHGAEASKQYWMDKLNFDQGPTKIKAALDEVRSLMYGRLSNVAAQKERAFGTPTDPWSLLGPKEQEIALKISQGTYKGQQQQPGAQAPAAAGGFQEGQTATNPKTGKRVIFKNGQWQPL